jgi:hypothetical protein
MWTFRCGFLAAVALLCACPAWAADVKISALPAASALAGTEVVPAVQSGTTVKATASQVATYALGTVTSQACTLTVSFATPGSSVFTYGTRTCSYVQVGKLIVAQFTLPFTPTTLSGAGGNLQISGLPTAAGTDGGCTLGTNVNFVWSSGRTQIWGSFLSTTLLGVQQIGSNVAPLFMAPTNVTVSVTNTVFGFCAYVGA